MLTSIETYDIKPENAWNRLKMRVRKPIELAILMELAAWREREAQSKDVPRGRIMKDETIFEIAAAQPTDANTLGQLRSLSRGFERSKAGEDILACVKRAMSLPKSQLPAIPKGRPAPDGSSSAVEMMKVLLKLVSEQNGVAAKVIATVDELEAIAADDDADVPALKGWRRDLFGAKAIDLKHGRLALAIRNRRTVAIAL